MFFSIDQMEMVLYSQIRMNYIFIFIITIYNVSYDELLFMSIFDLFVCFLLFLNLITIYRKSDKNLLDFITVINIKNRQTNCFTGANNVNYRATSGKLSTGQFSNPPFQFPFFYKKILEFSKNSSFL